MLATLFALPSGYGHTTGCTSKRSLSVGEKKLAWSRRLHYALSLVPETLCVPNSRQQQPPWRCVCGAPSAGPRAHINDGTFRGRIRTVRYALHISYQGTYLSIHLCKQESSTWTLVGTSIWIRFADTIVEGTSSKTARRIRSCMIDGRLFEYFQTPTELAPPLELQQHTAVPRPSRYKQTYALTLHRGTTENVVLLLLPYCRTLCPPQNSTPPHPALRSPPFSLSRW